MEHNQKHKQICLMYENKPHWFLLKFKRDVSSELLEVELLFTTTDVWVDECLFVDKSL